MEKAQVEHALCDVRLARGAAKSRGERRSARVCYFASQAADGAGGAHGDAKLPASTTCETGRSTSPSSPSRRARPERQKRRCTTIATCSQRATPTPTSYCSRAPTISSAAARRSRSHSALADLLLFPLHSGAATLLIEKARPSELLRSDRELQGDDGVHRADRVPHDGGALATSTIRRRCARASRPARRCRRPSAKAGTPQPGLAILDGIGSTEMLHIFIGSPRQEVRAGFDRPRRSRLHRRDSR